MKILALLKGDHRDENILTTVKSLATSSDEITILNVTPVRGEIPLQRSGEVLDFCTEFDLSSYHNQSKNVLDDWNKNQDIEHYKKITKVGDPAKIAVSTIEEEQIELVISGAHLTSGLEDFLINSFSSKLINHVDIPYLTVSGHSALDRIKEIAIVCAEDLKENLNLEVIRDLQVRKNASVRFIHIPSESESESTNWGEQYHETAKSVGIENYSIDKATSSNIEMALKEISEHQETGMIAFSESHLTNWSKLFKRDNRVQIVNHLDHPILIF